MKANQQHNNHLQWETAFLLTLAMFPLIGIGPIVAFTVGYFFRQRGWGWNLGLMGLFVLGIQILIIGSFYIILFLAVNFFDSIPEKILYRLFNSTFYIIPLIGVIIGFIKKNKDWATLLKQVSLSCLLVVVFVFSISYFDTIKPYTDDTITIFTNILLGFPILFVSVCIYRYRHRWNWGVFISGIILIALNTVFVTLATPNFIKARYQARCAELKSNLHEIQIALHRHSTDTLTHPASIQILIDECYLYEMPTNALTGERMREVPFNSDDYKGNFTYLTHIIDGEVNGFYLIVYGSDLLPAQDINEDGVDDHVLMVIMNTNPGRGEQVRDTLNYGENLNTEKPTRPVGYISAKEYIPLPDLKDLLNETYNGESK